tara:strand:- start:408 stop:998 length:591 start_codon:yes stop_codon:yes gene_type:complete
MKLIINDYIFYKITCDDLPEYIYIGSTVHFIKRKCDHKITCNNPNRKGHNIKLYQTIRDNGGWEKWDIIVIDEAKQVTLTEARIKEESLRKEYNGNLNSQKAYRSVEEAKEYEKEWMKQYRESNKELVVEKTKIYYQANKEDILEKQKEYYQNNKKSINEKITCECGSIFIKKALNRHLNTLKHQQFCQPIDLSII